MIPAIAAIVDAIALQMASEDVARSSNQRSRTCAAQSTPAFHPTDSQQTAPRIRSRSARPTPPAKGMKLSTSIQTRRSAAPTIAGQA